MLFATFFIERDPLRTADVPAAVTGWLQVAGGYAAAGLFLWLLAYAISRSARVARPAAAARPVRLLFGAAAALAAFFYAVLAVGNANEYRQGLAAYFQAKS